MASGINIILFLHLAYVQILPNFLMAIMVKRISIVLFYIYVPTTYLKFDVVLYHIVLYYIVLDC